MLRADKQRHRAQSFPSCWPKFPDCGQRPQRSSGLLGGPWCGSPLPPFTAQAPAPAASQLSSFRAFGVPRTMDAAPVALTAAVAMYATVCYRCTRVSLDYVSLDPLRGVAHFCTVCLHTYECKDNVDTRRGVGRRRTRWRREPQTASRRPRISAA